MLLKKVIYALVEFLVEILIHSPIFRKKSLRQLVRGKGCVSLSGVSMIKLDCVVQQYAWGKTGRESSVAKFKK